MPITLPDKALEELESVGDLKQASTCFRWKPHPLEVPADTTVPSFEEGRFRKWIVSAEAEVPSAQERWAGNYYRGIVTPISAALVIHGNEVVGIVFDNDAATGGYIALNNDDAVGGNVAANWQMPSVSFSVGISTIGLPLALEQRLEQLRQLPEGWDSYGACRVSDKAIRKAKSVLLRASTIIGFGFLKELFISPCTDGGLEIESDLASGKELFLDIAPTGESITFLLVETTPEGEEKEKEGEIQEIEDLDKLLRRASN